VFGIAAQVLRQTQLALSVTRNNFVNHINFLPTNKEKVSSVKPSKKQTHKGEKHAFFFLLDALA
jgi:hypothetical protein